MKRKTKKSVQNSGYKVECLFSGHTDPFVQENCNVIPFPLCSICSLPQFPSSLAQVLKTGKNELSVESDVESFACLLASVMILWAQYNLEIETLTVEGLATGDIYPPSFPEDDDLRGRQGELAYLLEHLEDFGNSKFGTLRDLEGILPVVVDFLYWRVIHDENDNLNMALSVRSIFACLTSTNIHAFLEFLDQNLSQLAEQISPVFSPMLEILRNKELIPKLKGRSYLPVRIGFSFERMLEGDSLSTEKLTEKIHNDILEMRFREVGSSGINHNPLLGIFDVTQETKIWHSWFELSHDEIEDDYPIKPAGDLHIYDTVTEVSVIAIFAIDENFRIPESFEASYFECFDLFISVNSSELIATPNSYGDPQFWNFEEGIAWPNKLNAQWYSDEDEYEDEDSGPNLVFESFLWTEIKESNYLKGTPWAM